MMAEGDLVALLLHRSIVKNAAAQARAQSAGGLSFRNNRFDDRVGIAFNYLEWNPQARKIFRENVLGESRLLLVEIHRQEIKADRSTPLQIQQQAEQCIAVLAATQTNHDPVAILDHLEIGDGPPEAAQKLRFYCFRASRSRFLQNQILPYRVGVRAETDPTTVIVHLRIYHIRHRPDMLLPRMHEILRAAANVLLPELRLLYFLAALTVAI